MSREAIPEDVQRFILTCIQSVPQLEAILLMRSQPGHAWNSKEISQRLYLSEKKGKDILSSLHAAGFLSTSETDPLHYSYAPHSEPMTQMVDRVAEIYAKNIIGVATLIHSNLSNQAQQFADAFKWRKSP